MKKLLGSVLFCLTIYGAFWTMELLLDRTVLNDQLIRLHIVANSDSDRDQMVKLKVRDAVLDYLQEGLCDVSNMTEAKVYIQSELAQIEQIANETLRAFGVEDKALASFCRERFDVRHYDTFSLPSGMYESVRILIGEGKGHNWWCVTYPSFCIPAASQGFETVAAGAGFSSGLTKTLTGVRGYEVRFYLLDKLGQWKNNMTNHK